LRVTVTNGTGASDRQRQISTRADALSSVLAALNGLAEPSQRESEGRAAAPESDAVLVVHCPLSDHSESEWPVDPSWTVVEVPTLGAQVRDRHDGETVLDGTIAQVTRERNVTAALVVGHTGCTVVRDAHQQCLAATTDAPPGVEARLQPLVALVEDAFAEGVLSESTPPRQARARLVEYTVARQVEFLRGALPASTAVAGYVHDESGAYSSVPDTQYLVATGGTVDPADITARLPEEASVRVASLLQ
jgi:carbonic anhydrase